MLSLSPSFKIGNRPVYVDADNAIISYVAGMEIDADGAPEAYKPDDSGLDALVNAQDGHGRWCGLVVVNGRPYIDPATGWYVSTTSYQRKNYSVCDVRRYLDASTVPYIVVPPQIIGCIIPVVLGSRVIVRNQDNGKSIVAMVGDIGPQSKLGEASCALAEALGIPSSPRTGGTSKPCIAYEIHAGVPAVINGETFELQRWG